jgi:TetR/AcrR family transcriptional regulator, cholesterol catabolism regulator
MKSKTRERLSPEDRIQRILDGALDLFSRQPYAAVTTRDIAAACGVNVALIYYYFKNKDVLFHAVIKHAIDQALQSYKRRTRDVKDPVEALDEWFQVNLELFTPLKKMSQILVAYNNAGRAVPAIDNLINKFYRDEQRMLYRCLLQGIKSGQFRQLDAKRTAIFIANHLDGLCFASMTRPKIVIKPLMAAAWEIICDYLGVQRPRGEVTR